MNNEVQQGSNVQANNIQSQSVSQPTYYANNSGVNNNTNNIPQNYKPLSPWAYFGYQILFSLPIIGLILLLIFAFNNDNINRKNFARSYFCTYLLALIIVVIVVIITTAFMAKA